MKSKKLSLILFSVLGFLLLLQVGLTVLEETVQAQALGSDRFMIVVNGCWRDNEEPVYVLNTREQVISVYEYNSEENKMKLVAVRSYKWGRVIREYNNGKPSVSLVQNRVGPR